MLLPSFLSPFFPACEGGDGGCDGGDHQVILVLVFLYCVAQVGVLEPALTFKTSSCSQTSSLFYII